MANMYGIGSFYNRSIPHLCLRRPICGFVDHSKYAGRLARRGRFIMVGGPLAVEISKSAYWTLLVHLSER